MVTFTYIDDNECSITKWPQKTKVAMFGKFVPFMPVGDKAISQQCMRCWKLGHIAKYCMNAIKLCYICRGAHDKMPHNHHCPSKSHKVLGICDCKLTCLVCKGDNHMAHSVRCPLKPNVPIPKVFGSKVKRGIINPKMGLNIPQAKEATPSNKKLNFTSLKNREGVQELSLATKL